MQFEANNNLKTNLSWFELFEINSRNNLFLQFSFIKIHSNSSNLITQFEL